MKDFITKIPKSDLHVHLDGSIRPATLIDLSKKEKLKLPSNTVAGLDQLLFKDAYGSLEEYLTCFAYTLPVMQTPENLEQIAYEFAKDNQEENVCYVEVRFAPQLHINKKMDLEQVLVSVDKGMKRAMNEYNGKLTKDEKRPRFVYGIIVCAMRSFGRFSDYFGRFLDAHPFSKTDRIASMASFELVQGIVRVRDKLGIPIVGFDLAGQEDGFPAKEHWEAYQFAHENFLHRTVHAGEAFGPESIFQAITELHADRIGHGYYLFDESRITDPRIKDRKKYVKALAQFIAERRINIEVCLTSNLQTNPSIGNLANHQFKKMRDAKLSVSFCTDNRTVSKTTVTKELDIAVSTFNLSRNELKDYISYGLKRSFYPGPYAEKREYIKSVIQYFEQIESNN